MKTEYYFELLMLETMKLLVNIKNNINKDKDGENVPHLETTEAVLVHCNIVKMIINMIQESCINLSQINRLVSY